jgi:hypothetical protein
LSTTHPGGQGGRGSCRISSASAAVTALRGSNTPHVEREIVVSAGEREIWEKRSLRESLRLQGTDDVRVLSVLQIGFGLSDAR